MKQSLNAIRRTIRHIRSQKHSQALYPLLYTNDWSDDFEQPRWWSDFVNKATDGKHANEIKLEWTSVFGPRWIHHVPRNRPIVFFSPEDTEYRYRQYDDYLAGYSDLALGFKYRANHQNYLRFPLWINYFISSDCALDELRSSEVTKFLDNVSSGVSEETFQREIFCSLIASHDERGNGAGLRTAAGDRMGKIAPVHYEGRFRNNSTRLKDEFNDDINSYLGNCTFNICLENTNSPGYTTEKLFQALVNGAVPIYWGSCGNPEPEILTGNGIVFFDPDEPDQAMKTVKQLRRDSSFRAEFLSKPILQDSAHACITETIEAARTKILNLIS